MELPLVNVSTCELRSVIRFFTAKNETAVNIHSNLVSLYGEECMSIQMVRRWRSWFLEGRQNVHDDERSGRPVTATDNAAVRNVVEADRRVTIDEIMIRLPPGIEIGRSSIGTIMSDILNFRKVCARWVPRLLLENHKQQRMEAARAFLEMHQRDGDQLFSRIVTGDESWVHNSTPETKRQSMVWKKPEESAPKKAKVTISAGKVMAMENFKWEIVTHPPYSPELAPSDFHLFPALKWYLGGKHFANDDEVQAEENYWLRRQDTAWYNSDVGLCPRRPNLLQRVITGDEAWVYGHDVETKAQSSQWKLPHEPRPKKALQVRSNVKVLLTVFFDCRSVVHHEFLPQGRTVNKEYYLQVMRNLREANARICGRTKIGFCTMQLPYSPDLAPKNDSLSDRRDLGILKTTVDRIMRKHLDLRKLSARWVPKPLTPDQKAVRRKLSSDNLALFEANPEEFQQSMQWIHSGSPPPKKAKTVPSAGKVMVSVFWDSEGVLLLDFLNKGQTITGDYYENLVKQLREAIKEKRRGKLSRKIVYHPDNAPSHRSLQAMATIYDSGFELLPHAPYSPELAPSDFNLFFHLNKSLSGIHFRSDEEVIDAVSSYIMHP
ncbi:hypothetical protein LAZ67_8000923 [Cordylochernes scorpioides]|uniref:Transposase n=1 Tax=Cordylochernes scorpioides TaxID=51811 RepID=A0ABY6KQB7_9ARAC|nr:hypothetical protein LAZ67_8000923 [Cordylochernes scorpioides]